jgi:hypothetical protein
MKERRTMKEMLRGEEKYGMRSEETSGEVKCVIR